MGRKYETSYFRLDIPDSDSEWTLVVIDDRWDAVSRMIRGAKDAFPFGPNPENQTRPLGEKVFDIAEVDSYYQSLDGVNDNFERATFLTPAAARTSRLFRRLILTGFPEKPDDLLVALGCDKSRVVFLLDQLDASTGKDRLEETWHILDKLSFPRHVRLRFTRGASKLNDELESCPLVSKQPPSSTNRLSAAERHVSEIANRLEHVCGLPAYSHFAKLTNDDCHNPSELNDVTRERRVEILEHLVEMDPFGAWKWCESLVTEDHVSDDGKRRWLCAKSSLKETDASKCPVTALIGIIEGAKYLPARSSLSYPVESHVASIPAQDIDLPLALGTIVLQYDTYFNFAPALRDWLLAPEQFEDQNHELIRVSIVPGDSVLEITFAYSGSLPEEIFNTTDGGRGRTNLAWSRLACFSKSANHDYDTVKLTFNLSP